MYDPNHDEAFDVYDVVKGGNVKFQLGHQNRQIETHMKAKELLIKVFWARSH
jgi:predicted dehydrogenase